MRGVVEKEVGKEEGARPDLHVCICL
jgi:hypothetical protein